MRPFLASKLNRRGTAQIMPETNSAEEFPLESTRQGGAGAVVFPSTLMESMIWMRSFYSCVLCLELLESGYMRGKS